MGLAVNRGTFRRVVRRALHHFLALVIAVSTLSAISVISASPARALSNSDCAPTVSGLTASAIASGNDCIITFTAGTGTWTIPNGITSVAIVVVGGGGGGGGDGGSGGGGGELRTNASQSVTAGSTATISIGAGGNGGSWSDETGSNGKNGSATTITGVITYTANGGSGGGGWITITGGAGGTGGSGGTGTNGGAGGGGPGNCAVPHSAARVVGNLYFGANGSSGPSTSVIGSATNYAGGGGGGLGADTNNLGEAGRGSAGGAGGGGRGSNYKFAVGDSNTAIDGASAGQSGTANTGGGGGAGAACNSRGSMNLGYDGVSQRTSGGAGAQGVVIVRYLNAPVISVASSPVTAFVGTAVTSYSISNSGGAAASYAISPALAVSGLTFSTSTGLISGTPTAAASSATYTITATNASGTSSATFSITSFPSSCSPSNTLVNGYTVLQFQNVGSCTWNVPTGVTTIDILVVGGGGAGGALVGGGGGAGGYLYSTSVSVTPGAVNTITVGAGGVNSATAAGGNGGNSSFNQSLIAIGGGGGGTAAGNTDVIRLGSNGGSGGGASSTSVSGGTSPQVGTGTAGQGNNGGISWTNSTNRYNGGGGGGSLGVGGAATEPTAGKGGAGTPNSISGTSVCYATGGGGAYYVGAGTSGAAGDCAGTANPNGGRGGITTTSAPTAVTANTGGGGGGGAQDGATWTTRGANGGSGVVIVRYEMTTSTILTPAFGTPTATATGYKVQITNYSASYTWAGTATASGSVAISNTGLVTVTGVAAGTSATATITTARTGYTGGSSTVTGTSFSTAAPGAPTIGTATLGNGSATVTFTAPTPNGGSTITSYTATSSPGGFTRTLSGAGSGTITVSGLTNGTAYTFTVTATNASGTSSASAASNSVIPRTVPGAPTSFAATAGNNQVALTWAAPSSNGGSAITGYTVTSSPSVTAPASCTNTANLSCTFTGLTNGTAYTFTIRAINAAGNSATVTVTATPGKASQTITFNSLNNRTLGTGTYSISASSNSSLTVALTSATIDVCTISSGTITLVSTGTCTINADQAGDDNYLAATQVQRSFTVATALTITTPSGSSLEGNHNSAYSLTISASGGAVSNSFAVTGSLPTGVRLSGGVISGTPSAAGNFSLTVTVTDANGATATTSSFTIAIAKGASTVALSIPSFTFTGSPQGPDSVTKTGSTGSVTYAYAGRGGTTYASSSTKPTAVGTYTVTATVAADDNFASVSASGNFEISNASLVITPTISASSMTFGTSSGFPTISYTKNPDISLSTNPTCALYLASDSSFATTQTIGSTLAAGSYVVRCTGGAATNYTVSYGTNPSFSVTAAALIDAGTPTVAATAGVLKSISVSWTAVTNASSYTLKLYATDGSTLHATLTGVSGTSRTITASDYSSIADNTAYKVSITAIGTGNYSSSAESAKAGVTTGTSYTVTYNYNSATGDNSKVSDPYISGGSAVTLQAPTRTGYTFGGWYVATDFSGSALGSTYTPTSSLTINAKWNQIVNGSLLFSGNTNSYLTIPNSENLKFGTGDFTVEWWQYQTDSNPYPLVFYSRRSDAGPFSIGVSIESNVLYWWSEGTTKCSTNLGAGSKDAWMHLAVARSSGTTNIFRDGTVLCSFSDTANYQPGTVLWIGQRSSQPFAGKITNFHWVKGTALYTSTFLPSDSATAPDANAKILLNAQNESTLITDLTGLNTVTNNGNNVTWSTDSPFTRKRVIFNSNGGTGTMSNQMITVSTSTALTANSFSRTGYSFAGWNTDADGTSGTSYTNQESVSITAGMTLYAKWAGTTATLSGLTLSSGTLSTTFASGTTSYSVSVVNSVSSITVTPTRTQAGATITVNGTSVTSGSASGAISLNVGSNTITVVGTAQNGTTTATYTLTVTRASSTVSPVIGTQPIAASKAVGESVSFTVAATVSDGGTLSYQWQKDGSDISGATSATYTFTTTAVSNAGNYQVVVTNTKNSVTASTTSNSVALTMAKATPTFNSWSNLIKMYSDTFTVTAPVVVGSIAGTFTYSSATTSVISVSGTTLSADGVGSSVITATFTPTNTTDYNTATKTMTVTVNRAYQTMVWDPTTSLLMTDSPATLVAATALDSAVITYQVQGAGVTGCTINSSTRVLSFTGAGTCQVMAQAAQTDRFVLTSISKTFTISLATRTLTIDSGSFTSSYGMAATAPTITSTASAGTGTKSYTSSTTSVCTIDSSTGLVTFVAPGTCTIGASIAASSSHSSATASTISFTIISSTATLSGLVLSTGTLSPSFASATTSYTVSVLYATSSITVTPTRTQSDATITVNGTAVNSGSASGSISLNVGSNTITVVVTAQDGVTTRTYTVTVTRAVQVFTITYAAGTGGSGSGPTSPTSVNDGATFTTPANTYSRTLYTFAGWYDGTNTFAAGTTYPSSGSVSGNVTLTATWNLDACSTTTSTANGYTSIVIATVGTCGWVVPDGITNVDVLAVGGGGAGGTSSNGAGGGGGGGQVNAQTNTSVSGVITIQVGAGGTPQSTASATPGGNGGTTSFTPGSGSAITATGGSGGASVAVNAVGSPSATGFNGGGGSVWANNLSVINGTNGVGGFKGGASIGSGSDANIQAAGGGGGSGAVGANAVSSIGGAGGVGVSNSYSGTAIFYGGGGGGGKRTDTNGSAGLGGSGGGGAGGRKADGSAGTANTGGGGGGAGGEKVGGAGGSGVVIIRYTAVVDYTYDANGGTGTAPVSGSARGGTAFTTAANPFTRTGYTFAGWYTTANGTGGTAYTENASNTMQASGSAIVLYAKWTIISYTITYAAGTGASGTGPSTPTSVNHGSTFVAPANTFTRTGYTFLGWSDGTNTYLPTATYPSTGNVTANLTLTATWEATVCSPTSTTAGGYTVYSFTTVGTCVWTVPNGVTDVQVLAVAGGAGGGYSYDNSGAGGGAGGQVKTGTATLSTTLEVTVGAGGAGGTTSSRRGSSGGNSVVSTITALGGTGGCGSRSSCADSAQATSIAAANGGAGGDGGASGKGGGGSSTSGSVTSSVTGGAGTASNYSGSSVTYGVGGVGGTARAALANIAGTAGSANTGNGGGGASAKSASGDVNGGSGGSGLVIVRVASALTVAFNSQSGTSVSDTSTVAGGVISTAPTEPTRTNYSFLGWFTASTGGTAITFPYTHGQTANFTLYAQWSLSTYAITFNANSGLGSMANQSVTHGVAANLNANLYSRTNYVFYRWATAADGTGTTYNNLAQITLTAGTTLYAQWSANTYVVTFNYNGGNGGDSTATSSFTTGGTAITLPVPTKTGFTFAGWHSDSALSTLIGSSNGSGTYSPTGATLTLNAYAKWSAVNYTFTYNANSAGSGTVPTETSKQITQTATVKANTGSLERAGYTFGGWNTQSNGTGDNYLSGSLFTVGAANVVLYAKWNANTYTATYNVNGGSGNAKRSTTVVTSDSYTTGGTSVTLPDVGTLTRSGYTFAGWNTSAAGDGTNRLAGASYTTVSDVILYAKWTAVTYTITYNANSGTGSAPTSGGYTTGQASPYSVLTNTFTKTSHVFGGWNTASNGTGTSYSPGSSITTLADIVLYAVWIPQFTLHYAINGGTVDAGSTLPPDALLTINTPVSVFSSLSRTGYTFNGWTNGASTIAPGGSFNIIEDSVLTAKWTAINYQVSYNSDGGTTPPTSFTKQIGQSYAIGNAPSKPGHDFLGWKTGSTIVGTGATIVMGSSDVSYTAQWAAQIYTISYDWNGGRGTAVSDVNYTFGTTAISLPLVGDRVKDGYTFAGWSESTNGSLLGATYTPSQTRTLYALWNIGNFTVTYNLSGGSLANTSVAVQNGSSTVLPLPTRANFVFDGWHSATTGGSSIGSNGASFTPNASQTVYARWIQASLYGITDWLTRIGSVTTVDNVGNTFSGANSNSSVAVSVPANALPAGTTINFDMVGNSSRARGLLPNVSYLISIAVSWIAGDGTVPNTASGQSISVTISNATIKTGATAYAIVNNVSTVLGTATQDGTITIELTSDPEVVVAAVKPTTPTNVAATSNGNQQSVISWSAPTSNGGSDITGYTVTSSPSVTAPAGCSGTTNLSCAFTGLSNGTAYTFTVTATNSVGTSVASTSTSGTTASVYAVTFDAKGGTSVTGGSFLTASTVSAPTAPTRTGYSFAGWSATDGGSAEVFPYAPGVTSAITMYARWDALDNAVTFDSKGGSDVTATIFSSGGTVAEPTAPTKSGYTFAGWSATDGGAAVTFPYAPGVVTDITLYAKWAVVSQNSSSGSGGGSSTPAPSEPSGPINPVKSNVTVVAPVTVIGNRDAKVIAVDIATPTTGSGVNPLVIKVDKASEKFIAEVRVVEGKLVLTPETGFSGKKTVTVTITENGTDRIIQIPLTVLPEVVTKPVLTPASASKTIIRWTASPNADAYTVYLYGKKVCSTSATSCSVARVLGPDANVQIISNGGDRTISDKVEAEFKQSTPVAITRIVSATITKATLTKVDTKALDKVIALIKTQGFGTVVISQITTTKKTQALADARIAAIKKYIDSKSGSEEITFEVVAPASRTYFNNISVKG